MATCGVSHSIAIYTSDDGAVTMMVHSDHVLVMRAESPSPSLLSRHPHRTRGGV